MAKSIAWDRAGAVGGRGEYVERVGVEARIGRSVYEPSARLEREIAPILRLAQPDFGILRQAFGLFFTIVPIGLMIISLSARTSIAPLLAGIGVALLWLGCLVIVVAAYLCGLRSGYFLLSPRSSITAIIIFLGLALTAIIAGIEFTV